MNAASFGGCCMWPYICIHLGYLKVVFDFIQVSSYHIKWSEMKTL